MKKTLKAKKKVYIFHKSNGAKTKLWFKKISAWLKKHNIELAKTGATADVILVLGGDGTILEASRKFNNGAVILGLNLGKVGFLASVREPKYFLKALTQFFKGNYVSVSRMMLSVEVIRKGEIIFSSNALNDTTVQNLMGMVEMEVLIDKYPIQFIRGSGAIVSTATGSTGYNLSAHGPIVSPDIQCLIVTELLDHNTPTPSIVVKPSHKVDLKIKDFRARNILEISGKKEKFDVLLSVDGNAIFPLKKDDVVRVSGSALPVIFAELEKDYFFKSLQEKFSFE